MKKDKFRVSQGKTIFIRDEIKITNLGEYNIEIEYNYPYPFWDGGPMRQGYYKIITNNCGQRILIDDSDEPTKELTERWNWCCYSINNGKWYGFAYG